MNDASQPLHHEYPSQSLDTSPRVARSHDIHPDAKNEPRRDRRASACRGDGSEGGSHLRGKSPCGRLHDEGYASIRILAMIVSVL